MSSYEQKIKAELKWKIDHYFKDLDFDCSDLINFANYIKENKLVLQNILPLIKLDPISEEYCNSIDLFYGEEIRIDNSFKLLCTIFSEEINLEADQLLANNFYIIDKITKRLLADFSRFNYDHKVEKNFDYKEKFNKKTELVKLLIYKKIILPIYEHIINNIDERHFLEQLLERYKTRTEHFTKKLWKEKKIKEVDLLQHDLALYLFDQGIDYTRESNSIDFNRIDFLGKDFVVEVKQSSDLKLGGCGQLIEYLEKQSKTYGYLLIFIHSLKSHKDKRFKFKDESYEINGKIIKPYIIDLRIRDTKDEQENELCTASNIKNAIVFDINEDHTITSILDSESS
jgi:hypothetical protein